MQLYPKINDFQIYIKATVKLPTDECHQYFDY